MKDRYRIMLICSICVLLSSFQNDFQIHSYSSGAPAGNTGSPFDAKTCARSGCHSGLPSNISGAISSNVPVAGYIPGTTYTITCSCSQSGINKWGFEISPMNQAGNLLGSLVITNALTTKITGIKYITHTSSGTVGTGSKTWSFDWVAPVAGTGTVTFYGAFNYANGNGSPSGDIIHNCDLSIPENTNVGIASILSNLIDLKILENPVHNVLRLFFSVTTSEPITIRLLNQKGEVVQEKKEEFLFPGNYSEAILMYVEPGIYFISVSSKSTISTKKVIKI